MRYSSLRKEMSVQLIEILEYWANNTLDESEGGFVGAIDHDNQVIPQSSKGIILNTRVLWSFSAASNHLKIQGYNSIIERSFNFLKNNFLDLKYGGFYWELDYKGNPINKRKQTYAQAFAIYSLSEYYLYSKNTEAKEIAIRLYQLIEDKSYDSINEGYIEALSENWGPLTDLRLSEKDMNAEKTMNTHLHLLEAYTSLLKIHDHDDVKISLRKLIDLMYSKFLNDQQHFELFFNSKWELLSHKVSYGHDIEAAWLILDAATILEDQELIKNSQDSAIKIAKTFTREAIDNDGAVINETDLKTNITDYDRHWWPQVEGIIGLDYVFGLTKEESFKNCAINIWDFTKKHLIDHVNGEWFFRVNSEGIVYKQEDKVSMWKAPYHTSRACIKLNS